MGHRRQISPTLSVPPTFSCTELFNKGESRKVERQTEKSQSCQPPGLCVGWAQPLLCPLQWGAGVHSLKNYLVISKAPKIFHSLCMSWILQCLLVLSLFSPWVSSNSVPCLSRTNVLGNLHTEPDYAAPGTSLGREDGNSWQLSLKAVLSSLCITRFLEA